MASVVIADDHPIFVDALRVTLTDAGLEVVGTTNNGADLVGLVEEIQPDVVLLDLQMPGMSGLDCLAALRARTPDVKVIILSGSDNRSSIEGALALGAVCFVGKGVEPADLAATVRILASEAPIYSAPRARSTVEALIAAASATAGTDHGLTRRELEILLLACEGMSNGKLARHLWVTEQTVKFHLSNVYRKLDVSNRTQAAARARALGLTSDSTSAEPADKTG